MIKYAVVEISGRQYKVVPGKAFKVDFLGEEAKDFKSDKVLLSATDKDLNIGTPYLKEGLDFEVLGSGKERKIRVATYKSKANTRKVKGARPLYTTLKLKD